MPKIIGHTLAEHREQTMRSLLDAVDALVLEQGFESVSLRDIAERAGVARTAIYNYTPDRTALLVAAAERALAPTRQKITDLAAETTVPAPDRIDGIVRLLLDVPVNSASRLHLARALQMVIPMSQARDAMAPAREVVESQVLHVLADAVEGGQIDAGTDLQLVADMIEGAVEGAMLRALSAPGDADRIREAAVRFIRQAVFGS